MKSAAGDRTHNSDPVMSSAASPLPGTAGHAIHHALRRWWRWRERRYWRETMPNTYAIMEAARRVRR